MVAVLIMVGVESVSYIFRRAAKIAGVGRVLVRDLGAFARILEFILIVVAIVRSRDRTRSSPRLRYQG
ncbi:MAG: hypothetical protein OK474_02310 [Thaumarchaeota archaeon]|nr:hypothetical protein [Nitrososphaerota archaeon]